MLNVLSIDSEQNIEKFLMPIGFIDWQMTDELWAIIKDSILPRISQKIEFSGYCPDVFDDDAEDSWDNICTINLPLHRAVPFINSLFTNTRVIQCQQLLQQTIGAPLTKTVDLLCERNQRMSQMSNILAKDKTYNYYTASINELVAQFKSDRRVPANLREELTSCSKKTSSSPYTLAELAAFTMYKNPQLVQQQAELPSAA